MKNSKIIDEQILKCKGEFDRIWALRAETADPKLEKEYSIQLQEIADLQRTLLDARVNSKTWTESIDVNTVITSATGLVAMIAIMNFEKTDVIATKAFNIGMKWIGK